MARKILVVDDEADIRELLTEYLEMKGYDVEDACDGQDAIDRFAASPADAVVTDIRMPRLDGLRLIERLRAVDPDLPIIAMTGHLAPEDLEEARTLGADTVLKKPISIREFSEHLEQLLAQQAA